MAAAGAPAINAATASPPNKAEAGSVFCSEQGRHQRQVEDR